MVQTTSQTHNARPEPPESRHGHPRLVSVEYFWKDMLGMSSRFWYYKHRHDPGFPQPVYFGQRPMLVYDECVAYVERLMAQRDGTQEPEEGPKPKRHVGRPAGPARRKQ